MRLVLVRNVFSPLSTIGELTIDGAFACYTLEDAVRDVKVPGVTAIPQGTYRITVDRSHRFRRPLPRLHDVPGFVGVRIHPGNTGADTSGCVLVGEEKGIDRVLHSKSAFDRLFSQIVAGCALGEVTIRIAEVR